MKKKQKVLFNWLGNGDIRHTHNKKELSGSITQAINDMLNPDKSRLSLRLRCAVLFI